MAAQATQVICFYGTVIECNPGTKTVDVQVANGDYLNGVQILNTSGAPFSNDHTWLTELRGAYVLVLKLGSKHFILGTFGLENSATDTTRTQPIVYDGYGGADSNTYKGNSLKNYQNSRAIDHFSGDKVLRAGTSSTLALLREGIVSLRASSVAQIILGKFKDFIRMIARRIQVYTDFGEVHLEHNETGRVGLRIHGGADYASETHPDVAQWTVQAWVGDHPDNEDNRVYVKVNDVTSSEFVTLSMDIKGNMVLETSNDCTEVVGRDKIGTIERDRTFDIGGDDTLTVSGDRAVSVTGNLDTEVSGSISDTTSSTATYSASSTLTIKSSSAVVVSAPSISLN